MTIMEEDSSDSQTSSWISWFLSLPGHHNFCHVDEEFLKDQFSMMKLQKQVPNYRKALCYILDKLDGEPDEITQKAAFHLYGLAHARYILTWCGMKKMKDKYVACEFGTCPRVLCKSQALLPIGLSSIPFVDSFQLYCPNCEDIYASSAQIDASYFGTTFPHLFFFTFPDLLVERKDSHEVYVPRIFGFKLVNK